MKQGIHTFDFPKLLLVKMQRLAFIPSAPPFCFRTRSHISMGLWPFDYNYHKNLLSVILIQSYKYKNILKK